MLTGGSRDTLWNAAGDHNKALDKEDREQLGLDKPIDLEELRKILNSAQKQQEHAEDKKWKFTIHGKKVDIFGKMIPWIKTVIVIVDKVAFLDVSGHAALPWAGVKFFLQVKYKVVARSLIDHQLTDTAGHQ